MTTERLSHPEYPNQSYTTADALYDLREVQGCLRVIERCSDVAVIAQTTAAAKKIARVQRFVDEHKEGVV